MKRERSDDLLGALRELEREEANDALGDERWERLAAGTLSEEELAELSRAAAQDAQSADARALFEPLGPEAEERYARAIEAQIASPREKVETPTAHTAPAARPVPGAAPVISLLQRRSFFRVAAVSTALAAAAAVALMVWRAPPGGDGLPVYALTFSGGEENQRGEPSAALPRIVQGSRFVIALRPATPAAGVVEAHAFLVQAGRVSPLETTVRVSPDGAVRLAGRVEAAILTPGDAEIVAVIARPNAPPAGAASRFVDGEGRRVARQAVRVIEEP